MGAVDEAALQGRESRGGAARPKPEPQVRCAVAGVVPAEPPSGLEQGPLGQPRPRRRYAPLASCAAVVDLAKSKGGQTGDRPLPRARRLWQLGIFPAARARRLLRVPVVLWPRSVFFLERLGAEDPGS